MSMEQILETVRTFDGVLELAPQEGSEAPEIAWGDHFFYYSPDGTTPRIQPYATIVTKNYPEDTASELNREGRWRLNIHVGPELLTDLTGANPKDGTDRDFAAPDVIMPHPLYGAFGWIAVVNPGPATTSTALGLLRDAHEAARRRFERRQRS